MPADASSACTPTWPTRRRTTSTRRSASSPSATSMPGDLNPADPPVVLEILADDPRGSGQAAPTRDRGPRRSAPGRLVAWPGSRGRRRPPRCPAAPRASASTNDRSPGRRASSSGHQTLDDGRDHRPHSRVIDRARAVACLGRRASEQATGSPWQTGGSCEKLGRLGIIPVSPGSLCAAKRRSNHRRREPDPGVRAR